MGSIVVRVAREFRGDPAEWGRRPWTFVLWCYFQIQDDDRREQWKGRMERVNAAELIALAFHEPNRLQEERRNAIAAAAHTPDSADEARARGLRMLAEMERGGVLVS